MVKAEAVLHISSSQAVMMAAGKKAAFLMVSTDSLTLQKELLKVHHPKPNRMHKQSVSTGESK